MSFILRFLLIFAAYSFSASFVHVQENDVNQDSVMAVMKSKTTKEFLFSFDVKGGDVFLFLEQKNQCYYFLKLKEFKKQLASLNIQDPRVVFVKNHSEQCDDGQEIEVKFQGVIKNFCYQGPLGKQLLNFKNEIKKSLNHSQCFTEKN